MALSAVRFKSLALLFCLLALAPGRAGQAGTDALDQARSLCQDLRYNQAAALIQGALDRDPYLPEAHRMLGQCLLATGRREEAAESFNHALAVKPNDELAFHALAGIYEETQQYDLLIGICERFRAYNPRNLNLLGRLRKAYLRLGRFEDALDISKILIRFDPSDPAVFLDLSGAYEQLGRLEPARNTLTDLLKHHSGSAAVLCRLGTLEARLGRPEEADRRFRQALALQPAGAEQNAGLGLLLFSRARWAEAATHLKKALRSAPAASVRPEPFSPDAARAAVFWLSCPAFQNLPGPDAQAHLAAGLAYVWLGNPQAARRELETLRPLDRGLAKTLEHTLASGAGPS